MAYNGVNLGGWLVLERWITPSVFSGLLAEDEYTFVKENGEEAILALEQHRQNFITSADLEWLKENEINALRVPVPHWIFGGFDSYVAGVEYVDWLMDEARRLDLKVVLELHTAPGSQNGHDHSGKKGAVGWHKSPTLISTTLDVIELIAARYGGSSHLLGIGLLNEPSSKIDSFLLQVYYQEGYKRVRRHCTDQVAVIINDQFNPLEWMGIMTEPDFTNVWLDTHLYQAFSHEDKHASFENVLSKVNMEWLELIKGIESNRKLMIGEWSLGLNESVFKGMDNSEKSQALSKFYASQTAGFSKATAQFFWTYKTENMNGWSYRDVVKSGKANATGTIHKP